MCTLNLTRYPNPFLARNVGTAEIHVSDEGSSESEEVSSGDSDPEQESDENESDEDGSVTSKAG